MPPPTVLALSTFGLVLVIVVVLLALLVVGGIVASGRAARGREARLRADLERADRELAAAHAEDNGWDAGQMEAAARSAWDVEHPDERVAALHLVQVVDRPGTDADEAVYRVDGPGGRTHEVVLKRVGDRWTV